MVLIFQIMPLGIAIKILKRKFLWKCKKIPFPDNFFDVVISINCAHNLELKECMIAIKEMNEYAKQLIVFYKLIVIKMLTKKNF